MEFAVGARPVNGSRIPDRIAGFKKRHIGANAVHHAHRIEAQHFVRARCRGCASPELGVHRVDGHRLYAHQQVPATGHRDGLFERFQAVRCTGLFVANGFHAARPATSAGDPRRDSMGGCKKLSMTAFFN